MKAEFLTDLITRDDCPKTGGICFTVLAAFLFRSLVLGRVVTIPIGFQTDFLSIPRFLQWLFPPVGEYDYAAVLHDYLYRMGICTRKQADDALLEAMNCACRPNLARYGIWLGLRWFGWWVWNGYRRKQAAAV